MTFAEQLNNYMKNLKCSSSDLVATSGLSSTVISRYRNGERTPNIKGKQIEHLANGLYQIGISRKIEISKEEIYNGLVLTLSDIVIDFEQLSKNFNELISILNINIADLSRFISYDASFVSKIRSGSRTPSKPKNFIDGVCNYVVTKYKSDDDKKAVSMLINCKLDDLKDNHNYLLKLAKWLSTNSTPTHNYINDFLNNLDSFDLNEYIKAIHFDEMKIPFVPFYKSGSRNYYGLEEMKKGELDFFKATVLSKSLEPVFMCSDMPMEDMAADVEFGKKWMFAIAMTLKKGLHLNIIHNIDRPFNEMMLGLESWIPIYMTGQVSPFYLTNVDTSVYCHLNYVSGTIALTGECINGYHKNGKYSLTSAKPELEYYKQKTQNLLSKAKPLMEIYRYENKNAFMSFINVANKKHFNYRRILSSLPFHTLSEGLLSKLLKHNDISDENVQMLLKSLKEQKQIFNKTLQENIVQDEIYVMSKAEFEEHPLSVSLSSSFFEHKVCYSYEEYLEHLEETKKFEKSYTNYKINLKANNTFRNIQITICEKNWVMISKENSPSIHFVIHHPKLREAIENFIPPIVE